MSDAIAAPIAAPVVAPAAPATPSPGTSAKAMEAEIKASVAALENPKAPAAKPEPKADAEPDAKADAPKPSKHKIVVDGAEEEVELEDLIRRAQKATAADKRFQEAAQARKAAEETDNRIKSLFKMIKESPADFAKGLKDFGIDQEEFATKILEPILREQIEQEEEKLLPPEQKRARELEKKVAEYERQEAARKAEAEKAEQEKAKSARMAEQQKHQKHFGEIIQQALDATTLPKTPEMAMAMVDLMKENLERGLGLEPKQLAKDLEGRKIAEVQALLKASGATSWLPEEIQAQIREGAVNDPKIVEKVRKAAVAEFKAKNPMAAAKPVVANPNEKPIAPKKGSSMNAIMKSLMLTGAKRG